jgi:hypothetical protein
MGGGDEGMQDMAMPAALSKPSTEGIPLLLLLLLMELGHGICCNKHSLTIG